MVTASDGTQLATSLYVPTGAPPAGGCPAIVMFHGIGGTRASMNMIAEQTFANRGFVVLTADHRGHGQSGGLFNVNGPSEIQDARDLYDWLAARPGVDRAHIGAFGISLGGGVVFGALRAGVPFAAAEVLETWVDLPRALAPGRLAKSGAIFQFLNSVAPDRTSPELNGLKSSFLTSTSYAAIRSLRRCPLDVERAAPDQDSDVRLPGPPRLRVRARAGLRRVHEARRAEAPVHRRLRPRAVDVPGPRRKRRVRRGIGVVRALPPEQAERDRHAQAGRARAGSVRRGEERLVREPSPHDERSGRQRGLSGKTIGSRGKVVLSFKLPKRKLEVFGAPVVTVKASTRSQAKQLTAVIEAVAPAARRRSSARAARCCRRRARRGRCRSR